MSDRKIWIIFALAATALMAAIVLALAMGGDSSNVECVHIGSNPCVPLSK